MEWPGESSRAGGNGARRPGDERPRYQPLVVVLFAVAAGIVLDRYARLPLAFAVCWLAAAGGLLLWWLARRRGRHGLGAWLLLASIALTAAAWHDFNWHLFPHNDLARFAGFDTAPACVEAIAQEPPVRIPAPRETPLRAIPGTERSRLVVQVTAIRDGTTWRDAGGRCQLAVNGHLLGVRGGDRLRIFGQLSRPAPPRNPGEFDYAAHARSDRELVRLQAGAPECVVVVDRQPRWELGSLFGAVRRSGERIVWKYIGPERGHLASAILLGRRGGLPREETASYMVTGTVHLLVVSGLHVGILAMGLYGALRLGWLPRRMALASIMATVIVYTLVAGAQPPVLRAAVLAVLLCIAAWTGRQGVAFNSLAAAALVVLAINPAELFQTGTQLSFLCVATLVWFGQSSLMRRGEPGDPLDQLLAAARPWYVRGLSWLAGWNMRLLAATCAVWLTALPLVLHQFHLITPVAVLISPAVWALIFFALWSGFGMLLAGWLVPPLAAPFGAVANASLAGLEGVVQWAESLPAGHFWAPGPAAWWVVGFYLGLLALMFYGRSLVAPRWQVALVSAWILAGLAPPLARAMTRDHFDCTFVSVGHGTCVVLQAPGGETLVYDAGSLGSPEYATQSISAYLWHRGIMRIDALVLSHADVDHYNAVPGLLERFNIAAVYVSPVMFERYGATASREAPAVLRAAIDAAGVPIREIWAGDRLRLGPAVTIDVLHPPRRGVLGSENANSLTLAVEYDGRRLLLPGDLETPGIEDVMAEPPYDCDVLMAPHHGSRRSDPPGFAAWSTPEWVVISGGRGGEQLAPVVRTYEHAGARVLLTHESGAIAFRIRRGDERIVQSSHRSQ